MNSLEQDKKVLLMAGFKDVPNFDEMVYLLNNGYCVVLGDPAVKESNAVVYKKLFGYEMGQMRDGRSYGVKLNEGKLRDIYLMARDHNQLILARKKK